MKTIILTTGGTGGHIFPAQALAKKLSEQGFRVVIFGDKNYAKYHKPDNSYKFKTISTSQLRKSPLALFNAGLKISFGVLQSLVLLLKYQPEAVVAFGGYATFPVLISAVILRKKIILHEQNAHLGKVNRMFAKYANKIALSYEETSGIENYTHPTPLIRGEKNLSPLIEGEKNLSSFVRGEENLSSRSLHSDIGGGENLSPRPLPSNKRGWGCVSPNKFIFTGNPIREEIIALSKNEYQLPNFNEQIKEPDNLGYDVLLASEFHNQKYQKNNPTFNILVLGGSGGAKIFSEILPKAFFNLREEIKNHLAITMQCRADNLPYTFEQYKSFNINIVINSFFTDIDEQIKKSHLVIARSGSSSLAEFACAKKPMILVPFALAADNHQEKNARQIEKAGGAIVIKEQDFTINNITNTIEKLFDNTGLLMKMSENAFKCTNLEATENLVKLIIS